MLKEDGVVERPGFRLDPSAVTVLEVLNSGFELFRQRVQREAWQQHGKRFVDMWLSRVIDDHELRWPHRKILEFLCRQYDWQSNSFAEVHFSSLVRNARISKSRASGFLLHLERKQLIVRRTDGYRVYFRLRVAVSELDGSPVGSDSVSPDSGVADMNGIS